MSARKPAPTYAPSPYAAGEEEEELAAAYAPYGASSGHAPELSASFYHEAAAALRAVSPAATASSHGQHAQQSSTPNPFLGTPSAYAPAPNTYAATPSAYAGTPAGGANPFTSPADSYIPSYYASADADVERLASPAHAHHHALSPGSVYDDNTEVAHTPMPALSYAQHAPPHDAYAPPADAYAAYPGYAEQEEQEVGYGYEKEWSRLSHDGAGDGKEEWREEERDHEAEAEVEMEQETMHFGPAPARGAQLRRNKTRKAVKLTQGNLVLDCPVPTKLQSFLTRRGDDEFTRMRYTAVTCDPDDFASSHFTLRPAMLNRHTELHIAVTMYNEDELLFTRTMHGVMKNIAHLCSRNKSRTWGPDGWKKVVVTIVADGRKKIHPRVLDCLAALGVYQEGVAKNMVNGKRVKAHIYEYTTQLSIDSNLQFKGAERGLVPMQIVFCMKEVNRKKIDSHRWFFNAFGPILQPNICILLDVGTRPEAKSIYHLWKCFDLCSSVAGAAGEIQADTRGKWGLGPALLNPLVAAQNFEYKISNILDKTTESMFGFISVLPGAFSAYRYVALQNDELGRGPLASYFKGDNIEGVEQTFSHANMYLAEDRILAFELAAKRNESWVLRYVKSARGVTDVPDTLPELISQRRRWLNGSFFAALFSLRNTLQFMQTAHGFWRKVSLFIEAIYNAVNLIFAWLSLGNFYIFFRLLTQSLESKEFSLKGIGYVNVAAQYLYLGTTIGCFILALGNRPQGSPWKFLACAAIYAVLTAYMMVAAVLCLVKAVRNAEHDAIYSQMVFSVLATYGVYFMASVIALDPLHLITSFAQYLLLAPTYTNILNTYAFANLHDFSWGTKGITADANDLGTVVSTGKGTVEVVLPTAQADIDLEYDKSLHNLRTRPMIIRGEAAREEKDAMRQDWFRDIRTNVLLLWVLSNAILAAFILGGDNVGTFDPGSGTTRSKVYMLVILVFIGAMSCVRFGMSTLFMIHRLFVG